jgi:hypothetical protein
MDNRISIPGMGTYYIFQHTKTGSGAFPDVFAVGTGGCLSAVKAC